MAAFHDVATKTRHSATGPISEIEPSKASRFVSGNALPLSGQNAIFVPSSLQNHLVQPCIIEPLLPDNAELHCLIPSLSLQPFFPVLFHDRGNLLTVYEPTAPVANWLKSKVAQAESGPPAH